MAVGDERAHAEFGREREPLAVMLLCGRRAADGGDLAAIG
jgi:hypothetical protein